MNRRVLADLLDGNSAETTRREVHRILGLLSPRPDTAAVNRVCDAVISLYTGRFPGYRSCSTGYHDLRHAMDTLLTMVRLVHGAVLDSNAWSGREILLALAAAGFHDAGYIQTAEERTGTGARFRRGHERRGEVFLRRHAEKLGLAEEEAKAAGLLVRCTDMETGVSSVPFTAPRLELLGRMLAGADLLAQLSDQVYLEKLPLLYAEDLESGEPRYAGVVDALGRAIDFHKAFAPYIARTLPGHDRLLRLHFTAGWEINANLYHLAIEGQHAYLGRVLDDPAATVESVLARLRRVGSAARTQRLHG